MAWKNQWPLKRSAITDGCVKCSENCRNSVILIHVFRISDLSTSSCNHLRDEEVVLMPALTVKNKYILRDMHNALLCDSKIYETKSITFTYKVT